ncbi:MAG: tripartite tricarboxylate transporter TctB family protein [Bacillota bacterium]
MNNVGRDIIPSSAMVLLSTWVFYETSAYPPAVRMLPRMMAAIILFFSLIIILKTVLIILKERDGGLSQISKPVSWSRVIPFLALWMISLAVVSTVGFYVTMGLFWLVMTWFLEGTSSPRQIVKYAGSSLAISLILYLVFRVAVGVPTPTGLFV